MKILHNHIGYERTLPKHAVILGNAADNPTLFRLINEATGQVVFKGVPQARGPVQRWKDWHFWTLDFDAVQTDGTYYVECEADNQLVRSHPFAIMSELLEKNAFSSVLYYFKTQRCSGVNDKADQAMVFHNDTSGRTVDVHGGWYDASGDYGKHLSHLCFSTYFNPQQLPMVGFSLFKSYEALTAQNNRNYRQYVKRILDEAMFGADYLVRVKNPEGSFYITVSASGIDKKPEDRRLMPAMRGFKIADNEQRDSYARHPVMEVETQHAFETSYRSGAGLSIAVLAMASTYDISGDFDNATYLKVAEDAFNFLEAHNANLTNDGIENVVDDYCALTAATALYKATKHVNYKTAADKRANSLIARLTTYGEWKNYWRADDADRPFFHAADAGLPVVSLLDYVEIADDNQKIAVLDAVRKSLEFELQITAEVNNPFGYARQPVQNKAGERRTAFFFPHDTETAPWWQGDNARLASLATAARLASRYFKQDRTFYDQLQAYALNQLNWILGLNPYDSCMLHGSGHNNPYYMFFDSYEYMNCPGGICNGITAGLEDEEDIDFQRSFMETGQDNDWRWGEQWLPHAAWFFLAVAVEGTTT